MNFLENGEMILPFFLLNSLRRMASNVQKRIQFINTTMYHHGLINILIEFHLKSIGDTWENFLIRNHFQEAPESPKEDNVRRSRRKNIGITIENRPESSLRKDDENLISEELTEIKKQIKERGKIRKEKKVTNEENVSPPQLRRSSRLRGLVKKTSSKGTKFINLDEETLEPSPVKHSP